MILLDSNIVIYASGDKGQALRRTLATQSLGVSAISLVEVLGYHRISDAERGFLESCFDALVIYPLTSEVVNRAVDLRQARKMSLGDALIAATALVHDLPMITRNTKDFVHIVGLRLLDSFPPHLG